MGWISFIIMAAFSQLKGGIGKRQAVLINILTRNMRLDYFCMLHLFYLIIAVYFLYQSNGQQVFMTYHRHVKSLRPRPFFPRFD